MLISLNGNKPSVSEVQRFDRCQDCGAVDYYAGNIVCTIEEAQEKELPFVVYLSTCSECWGK